MSGYSRSIRNGLIDFSVELCMSRNFEMKMTTKGKRHDEVKSDVLDSLSQDTEGRTAETTSCAWELHLITNQKVRLQQWDLPRLLIDTPCLTSARGSWSILGEIFFIFTVTKTDTTKPKSERALHRPNENLPRTSAANKRHTHSAENNKNLTATAISLNTAFAHSSIRLIISSNRALVWVWQRWREVIFAESIWKGKRRRSRTCCFNSI